MPEVIAGPPPTTSAPAAPAAPPPPAPPASTTKPVSSPAKNIADAFAQLDRIAGEETKAAEPFAPKDPPKAPKGREEPRQAQDGQQAEPEPTEAPEAPETDEQPEAKPDEAPKPKEKAATLRANYERLKSELAKRDAKIKELETAAPKADPEKQKLTETLEQREKRLQEVEEKLLYSDYRESDHFKTTYQQPYMDAYAEGRSVVSGLKIPTDEGEVRQGTDADFDRIMQIADPDAAAEAIETLFGTGVKAQMVINARSKVVDLVTKANRAAEDFKKMGATQRQAEAEKLTKARQEIGKAFDVEVKNGLDKYPQWFRAADGDETEAKILEEGLRNADLAFGKVVKDENGKPVEMTQAERVKLHAATHNMAAAFPMVVKRLAKMERALKAANKELEQYKASEPNGGDHGRKNKAPVNRWAAIDEQLQKLAR